MRRRSATGRTLVASRTILVGAALVVGLVALQPIALGLFPVIGGLATDEAEQAVTADGLGAGAGDMTAGALSSMLRDLNSKSTTRGAPIAAQARSVSPVVLVQLPDIDVHARLGAHVRATCVHAPATTRAGASEHGYQLLL